MRLEDRINFQKLIHEGQEGVDIEACGMEPYGNSTSKLDPEDANHPAQGAPAMHKDMKSAGFKYKGSRANGSTITHVYSHGSPHISDHSETVGKKQNS